MVRDNRQGVRMTRNLERWMAGSNLTIGAMIIIIQMTWNNTSNWRYSRYSKPMKLFRNTLPCYSSNEVMGNFCLFFKIKLYNFFHFVKCHRTFAIMLVLIFHFFYGCHLLHSLEKYVWYSCWDQPRRKHTQTHTNTHTHICIRSFM